MSHGLRSRGGTAPTGGSNLNDTSPDNLAGPSMVQVNRDDYAAFQAYQAHRRQASLSFETQGVPKRSALSLKTKDPNPYKGDTPEELDDFLYECERQFDAKGFPRERTTDDEDAPAQALNKEETMKKVAYATGFIEGRAKTDWKSWLLQFPDGADSWTHFKTLLQEFLEGDKEEAFAEGNQKLTNARQRRSDSVNEFYDYTYKMHIRLRALDSKRAMTDDQYFDYFRARLLIEYRVKLDELIPGPRNIHDLLHQVRRYEKSAKTTGSREDSKKDKSRSEGSSNTQDSKKDNKSGRAATHDRQKGQGYKKDKKDKKDKQEKPPFVKYKDKLSEAVRERRAKDSACYKCGLPGHLTRDCTAEEQVLLDTSTMLQAAKNK